MDSAKPPTAHTAELRERLSYLRTQLASGIPANFLGALIAAALVWGATQIALLILWVGAVFAATLYRWRVRQRLPDIDEARPPELEQAWTRMSRGIVVAGLAWGLGSVLAFPHESVAQQAAFTVIVAGMAAGAVPMLAVRFTPYAYYCLALLLPLSARHFIEGTMTSIILGATTLILAGMMLRAARDFAAMFGASVRMRVRLEDLAAVDPLTELGNRRHFDKLYAQVRHAATRGGRPLALLSVDVDHFKAYNDHYGHPAGDRCLVQIAEVLRGAVQRGSDVVTRVGGEEFLILLHDTDLSGARRVAEKISADLAERALPHAAAPERARVTVSIGAASSVPRPGEDPAALIEAADRALYRAKHEGRDRIEFEGELPDAFLHTG
jgi:diguanylate cyclase (GGDEF)-like protein